MAKESGAPLLAELPLDPSVRQWGDAGTPLFRHHRARRLQKRF